MLLYTLKTVKDRLPRSLRRFLVTGVLAVAIDGATYTLLLFVGVPVSPAKATGFVTGAVFAYIANRYWAFDDAENPKGSLVPFVLLYAVAILLNVSVNRASLWLIGQSHFGFVFSWFLATGSSATVNYIGMRYAVFRKAKT